MVVGWWCAKKDDSDLGNLESLKNNADLGVLENQLFAEFVKAWDTVDRVDTVDTVDTVETGSFRTAVGGRLGTSLRKATSKSGLGDSSSKTCETKFGFPPWHTKENPVLNFLPEAGTGQFRRMTVEDLEARLKTLKVLHEKGSETSVSYVPGMRQFTTPETKNALRGFRRIEVAFLDVFVQASAPCDDVVHPVPSSRRARS